MSHFDKKVQKKKFLKYFLCYFFFIFGSLQPVSADDKDSIPHAIGVYISPQGQRYFESGVDELLLNNGISIGSMYFENMSYEGLEQTLEDMLPEDSEMRATVLRIKREMQRFFIGLKLEKHRFNADLNDISFDINWEHMGATFHEASYREDNNERKIIMNVGLVGRNMDLSIGTFKARDLNHDFLGEIGIEGLKIAMTPDSSELRMELSVEIYKNAVGEVEFKVLSPMANIKDLKFDLNWERPIQFPEIAISINGHVATLNFDEVENLISENKEMILSKGIEFLQSYLETQAPAVISKQINEQLKEGISEINVMDPVGAPDGSLDDKYLWGLDMDDFALSDDILHIAFNGYVIDPMRRQKGILLGSYKAQREPGLSLPKILANDITLSVNQGFVNKIIQLSFNRGYFENFEAGTEKVKFPRQPVLKLKNRDGRARLGLEIEYKVTGMSAAFVKNPIVIKTDVFLGFPVDNDGHMKMIIEGIDYNSLHLDDQYIRMFKGTVRKAVRDKFKELEPTIKGTELVEEFPIPTSLLGIPVIVRDADVDIFGHLMVYLKYQGHQDKK